MNWAHGSATNLTFHQGHVEEDLTLTVMLIVPIIQIKSFLCTLQNAPKKRINGIHNVLCILEEDLSFKIQLCSIVFWWLLPPAPEVYQNIPLVVRLKLWSDRPLVGPVV